MVRRKNDFYPTPEFATQELLKSVEIMGGVLECCAGANDIARPLAGNARKIWTNDNDFDRHHPFHFDAADKHGWMDFRRECGDMDWVVTNPPFNQAALIVPLAYSFAGIGIAMLLRLSFLEPVEDRGAWLNKHPPTDLIVLPRISFTGNGKTDSVTCAWMVWRKGATQQRIVIAENPKFAGPKPKATAQRYGEWAGVGIMTNDIGPLP